MKPKNKTSNTGVDKLNEEKRGISLSELQEMASSDKYSKREISVEEAIENLENQADSEYEKINHRHQKAKESFNRKDVVITNKKAVVIAASLFVVTATALGLSNMMSNAALADGVELLEAEYIDFGSETTQSSDVLQELLSKKVAYTIVGKGTIEPYSNCTIDEDDLTISFTDNNADAQIKVKADKGFVPVISAEQEIQSSNGVITLNKDIDYGILSFTFISEEEAKNRPAFEDVDERTVISKVSFEGEDPTPSATQSQSTSSNESTGEESAYEPPAEQEETYYYEEAPSGGEAASDEADVITTTTTSTTYNVTIDGQTTTSSTAPTKTTPSTTPNSMSSDELAVAHEIFDAYNAFRSSRGLGNVSWSDNCANMAYSSSTQCAARGSLTHRLGIPASSQHCYSDILQYSSWRMSGDEAVNTWKNSTGHRKQMQCSSTTQAGVGVYYNSGDGRWYYTIVYDFSGTNVGGN